MDLVSVQFQIKANQYLSKTVLQLEKDFLLIGINFNIQKPVSDYKALFTFAYNLGHAINERIPKRILNLPYKIDLQERKVQEEM